MHRRYQYINVPTEIIRSIVVIAETNSFSKAAERLGLTQPAISAQVKRLQLLVGGEVFERNGTGVAFTPKGKLVLGCARKLLEANDQILSLGGVRSDVSPVGSAFPQFSSSTSCTIGIWAPRTTNCRLPASIRQNC
jgi:DNA-binding transcriptional LysR family regulator